MSFDMGQLSIDLSAKTDKFEKAFLSAAQTAVKAWETIESRGGQAASRLEGIMSNVGTAMNVAKGLGVAIVAFKAFEFAIDGMAKAAKDAAAQLESLVKIGNGASGVGVGSSFFQAWTQQAKALGTEASTLQEMLTNAFTASSVDITEGKKAQWEGKDSQSSSPIGSRIDQNVMAGNLTSADAATYNAATSQEARIRVVLDLIDKLKAKGMELAALDIANKMFGAQFESNLRSGTDMVAKMRESLNGMTAAGGARIIPPDEIARAQQMNDQLQSIQNRLAGALAPIREDIARLDQEDLQTWINIEGKLASVVELFGKIYSWITNIGAEMNKLGNSSFFKSIADFMNAHGLIMSDVQYGAIPATKPSNVPTDAGSGGDHSILNITGKGDRSHALPEKTADTPSAEDTRATEKFIAELEKSAAALQAETKSYNLNVAAKATAKNLAEAGAIAKENDLTLTAEETKRIKAASEAAANYGQKLKELAQQKEGVKQMQQLFGDDLVDVFKGATSGAGGLANAIKSIATGLEDAALKGALLGEGPLASFFGTAAKPGATGIGGLLGSIFNSGHADGGLISGAGGPKSDSIPAMLSNGEFVVNAGIAQKNLPMLTALNAGAPAKFADGGLVGGAGGSVGSAMGGRGATIHNNVTVNANGGTPEQNADLAKQIGTHVDRVARSTVNDELRAQMRPGGLLGR